MNNLSWFLYFADIAPGLLVPFIAITSIVTPIWIIGNLLSMVEEGKEFRERAWARIYSGFTYTMVSVFVVTVFIQSLIPSRETFYLIAGSELGEQVVKTPEAQEIFNDIRKVIKQQIKPVKETTE